MNTYTFAEIEKLFKEYGGPIFVKPNDTVLARYPQLQDCIGVISFYGSSTNINVDWSISENWNQGGKALDTIYPALQHTKWFTSDISVIYAPDQDKIPAEIYNKLQAAYKPGINKLKGDVIVFAPEILNNKDNVLAKYKGYIGVVRPLEDKTGSEFMAIFMKPRYSSFGGAVQILTPIEANWMKINKDDCLVVPPSFLKLIANSSGEEKDTNSNGRIITPTNHDNSSYPFMYQVKTAKFSVGDNVAVHWHSTKLDERLTGLCGTIIKVEKDGDDFKYEIDYNNLPNRSLALCKDVNIGDILAGTVTLEEDQISDTYAKRGFKHFELITWEYSASKEAYRTMWDLAAKKATYVTSVGVPNGSSPPPIYTKIDNKLPEIKLAPRALDYNYDKEKLLDAITLANSIMPAIESHGKSTYLYLYCFEEFSENELVNARILLGKAIPKNRNLKKMTKWCENSKNQSVRSALKYLESNGVGNIFNVLTEEELNNITFKEV